MYADEYDGGDRGKPETVYTYVNRTEQSLDGYVEHVNESKILMDPGIDFAGFIDYNQVTEFVTLITQVRFAQQSIFDALMHQIIMQQSIYDAQNN